MDDHDQRIRARAHRLWLQEGRPSGRESEFLQKARELVAIEDNQKLATRPVRRDPDDPTLAADEVEPAGPAAAEGDLPTLSDAGEQVYPPSREAKAEAAEQVPPDAHELLKKLEKGHPPSGRTKAS